jgi:hypothetical protein
LIPPITSADGPSDLAGIAPLSTHNRPPSIGGRIGLNGQGGTTPGRAQQHVKTFGFMAGQPPTQHSAVYRPCQATSYADAVGRGGLEPPTRGLKVRFCGVQFSPDECRFLLCSRAFGRKSAWSSGDYWSPLAFSEWTTDGLKILTPATLLIWGQNHGPRSGRNRSPRRSRREPGRVEGSWSRPQRHRRAPDSG